MRKWIQRIMVFSICMVLLTVSSINAFASMVTVDEEVSSEVSTTNSARSSFTLSIVPGEKFYAQSSWMYIGFSPTIKVTGRGNPDLQYRVRVQGTGDARYIVGYLYANGSTLSQKMSGLPAGNYWIFIEPWNGSSNNQTVYFDVTIS